MNAPWKPRKIPRQEFENQHFVPAVLQNRFRNVSDQMLYGFDKQHAARAINEPISAENSMTHSFTYALWDGGISGESFDVNNAIEHHLGKDYESTIGAALDQFEAGHTTPDGRDEIAKFLAVSMARHPSKLSEFHDSSKALASLMVQTISTAGNEHEWARQVCISSRGLFPVISFTPQEFAAWKAEPLDTLWSAVGTLLEMDRHDPTFSWADQLFQVAKEYETFFQGLNWSISVDTSGPFLLGDMPVVVNRNNRTFHAPISCRAVIIGEPPDSSISEATTVLKRPSSDLIDTSRYLMAGLAERWLVGPDPMVLGKMIPYLGSYLD